MRDLAVYLLDSLTTADDELIKQNSNVALKHIHDCIAKLKDYLAKADVQIDKEC